MNGLLTVAQLTLVEARQRKILLALVLCGFAFLALFGVGYHFMARDVARHAAADLLQKRFVLNFFAMAGLYAVNFLTVMTAVLMPADTLSGEIASGVMQTVAAKPVRRSAIVLGKWLAHSLVLACYLSVMAGGVLVIARLRGGVAPPHLVQGLGLMLLEGLVLLTLSIAGGTRLSTIANGVAVFGLYGLAFLGGWTEQIGAFANNATARSLGTAASLLVPSEAMWQLAAWHLQPAAVRQLHIGPFSIASVPSPAMVAWAVGYVAVTLVVAVRSFTRRAL